MRSTGQNVPGNSLDSVIQVSNQILEHNFDGNGNNDHQQHGGLSAPVNSQGFLALTFAFATLLAGPARGEAESRGAVAMATPSALPTSKPWPSYLALDYRKPGHPVLSRQQAASLREMLARLKPCQRRFVRYAFTTAANGRQFVMFFGPYQGGVEPHVLGAKNLYYNPREGRSFPLPGEPVDYSVRADSASLGCPAGDLITK